MVCVARFVEGSCVVLGGLNPAIIRPEWLAKNEIVSHGPVEITAQIGGAGFRLEFKVAGLRWTCSFDRLQIVTESPNNNPGRSASQVLDKLPETPVQAVGNNFRFELQSPIPIETLGLEAVDELLTRHGYAVQKGRFEISLAKPSVDAGMNMTLLLGGDGLSGIGINFHRNVPEASLAAEAAACWDADLGSALESLRELFEVTIDAAD